MGNMREISMQECQAVFGGTDSGEPELEIVVTGTRRYESNNFFDSTWAFGSGGGFGFANPADMFSSFGLGINGELSPFVDENGDGFDDNAEIVVTGPSETDRTGALNRLSEYLSSLPVSYFGFSGAFGLGLGFQFIYNPETGQLDVDVAATAGLGFFVEAGIASDDGTANDQSEATQNGWWLVGKAGGSLGGGSGDGGASAGGQVGAGGVITDTEIIP